MNERPTSGKSSLAEPTPWPAGDRYRVTFGKRLTNSLISTLIRLGAMPKSNYLLTTRGRRTGRPHTTPVTAVEDHGQRWLVAPYGPVAWVRNARADPLVTLTRGARSETVRLEEVREPAEAARVLKLYVEQVPLVRRYFQTRPDAPAAAFEQEADRHPVFRVVEPHAA
jgi:deazaflavin-dependent oxidoreductase (nitroreductase family)